MFASGMFATSSNTDNGASPVEQTVDDICEKERELFAERSKDAHAGSHPMDGLLGFWAKEGKALFSNMARIARSLLSVPASWVVLERDFSTAGRVITGPRSRLDGGFAEMVLFLNGNREHMPKEVQALSTDQGMRAVPRRLSHPSEEAASLSAGEIDVVEGSGGGDDYAAESHAIDVLEATE
ncbi:unnamed protein product [Pylaiella littoralis]